MIFGNLVDYVIPRKLQNLRTKVKWLPDSFTIDELIDQLIFMEKVEEGLKQSDEGKVISNEDVKLMIDKWPK
jgi:predicted transcriptional regulator